MTDAASSHSTAAILPGATLGMFGSGQLGRMFAIAARQMGYRVRTYSPDRDSPTGQVADVEVQGDYDDLDRVREFARSVDVVSLEFENISVAALEAAAEIAPVRPGPHVLHTTQHRLREKRFLASAGLPVAPFAAIESPDDIAAAVASVPLPGVIKTAAWGYDGKGQRFVANEQELRDAYDAFGQGEAVLEKRIDLEREVSVVAARGTDGSVVCYPPIENDHRNHILDVSRFPARLSDALRDEATDVARQVVERLDVVGVLCVEFFVAADGSLMINELAPRPHNSGHLTIEAFAVSQFEQQVRAVCGLPLGPADPLRPAAMANLLGDEWAGGEPDWAAAIAVPTAALHLYGKAEAKPGRKMGHITALGETPDEAVVRAIAARDALT